MPARGQAVVPTRPAATLVVLRPAADGGDGVEVLLTKRPESMRFGPGMVVFPGGRLEADETAADAAVRETLEETGIEVDPESLVPLTRWVTPYGLPSRFDARFFGAIVAAGTDVTAPSDEVAEWAWLRPTAALAGMAAGRLAMWQPTVVTLQQLEAVTDAASLRARFRAGPQQPASGAVASGAVPSGAVEGGDRWQAVPTTWSEGIEGRPGTTRVVGDRSWVVVDPPDPTDATVERVLELAGARGAALAGVVITTLEPERHAGVEMFARGLGLAVAGPPGAAGCAPYPVTELGVGDRVPFGDVPLQVEAVELWSRSGGGWADRAGRLRLGE